MPDARSPVLALIVLLAIPLALLAQPPADLELSLLTASLIRPVAVAHAGDGSGRLFVVEQAGVIRIWDGATLLASPFLDITTLVDDTGGEQGLLGLAFHPSFASNGTFYVNYIRDPGPGLDRTVIARYTVSAGDPNIADAASAQVILEIEQDFSNHNGGDLHFGPDGYLYIGMGDGGDAEDPNDRGQSLDTLLGKMLRIDVDAAPPPGPNDLCGLVAAYGIPADNPFAGGSGDCDEIWALGLRNPWRWSFDRATGDLLIGDVGQGAREEIDFAPAASPGGENYGWSCREGELVQNFNPCLSGSPLTAPILTYSHGAGDCSVTGGYRYRGHRIAGLGGTYLYADFCTGRTWLATRGGGGTWSSSLWADLPFNPSAFGEDEAGELYLLDLAGALYRFASPSSIFTDGFESGDLAAWAAAVP